MQVLAQVRSIKLASEFLKVLCRFVQVGFALTLLIVFGYYALSVTGSVLAQVSRPTVPSTSNWKAARQPALVHAPSFRPAYTRATGH
jgi:hypothetical protein